MPTGFSVLSEIPEATAAMLDSRILSALNKYGHLIDYIHISDQYNGPIQQEDPSNLKQPEVKRMLMAGFNLPSSKDEMEETVALRVLVFYLMERLKRFHLSKEVLLCLLFQNFQLFFLFKLILVCHHAFIE